MCKTYDTVYGCGHYKSRHVICEHGNKKTKTKCDGTENAHSTQSTKIQFGCGMDGCDDQRDQLKRSGPAGKDDQ